MDVIIDKDRVEGILKRGISTVLPSYKEAVEKLTSGRRLRFYLGLDATGPDLHLGHSKPLILLERIRRLGHEVIVIFGDFTAMIGDPGDQNSTRRRLSEKEIEENIKTWQNQIAPIISLKDADNPAKIKQNSQWLKKLGFTDVIDIASQFTVQHMLERDMFERRIKKGKPVWLHEFLYPLMQGYDSVALDVDGEVGGSDQTFNMLAGRSLQQAYNNKEKIIITTSLLEHPKTGEKLMSKSKGDYISLQASPSEMYGGVMALPDEVIIQLFTDCTFLPLEEINDIENELSNGANPRDIKMRLAHEIVSLYHGEKEAQNAQEEFVRTFQGGSAPQEIKEVAVKKGTQLSQILLDNNIVESKTEFKRLVEEGAIRDNDTDQKVKDAKASVDKTVVIKVGKRRFIRLVVE